MDDKEVVKLGDKCAKMFNEAWEINKQIENELVKRFGFKDVNDYMEQTGFDFENDALIDSLQQGSSFTLRDWKLALEFQKSYIDRGS